MAQLKMDCTAYGFGNLEIFHVVYRSVRTCAANLGISHLTTFFHTENTYAILYIHIQYELFFLSENARQILKLWAVSCYMLI